MRPAAFLLVAIIGAAGANEHVGGSVALTSDYRLYGLSQSDNRAAFQAELHLQNNTGAASTWFGGLWASTVRLNGEATTSVQLEAFLGYEWALDADWQTKLSFGHYAHPWNALLRQYDYDELAAEIAWRDAFALTVTYSPNTDLYSRLGFSKNRVSIAYEATARAPLGRLFAATAGAGYRDLDDELQTGYWYGSAGLAFDRGRLHASVLRVQTDHTASHLFYGDIAQAGWIGTLLWTF